jgi:DNA-binding MarR family transcriptional regulator
VLSNLASTGRQTQQQLADALGVHRNRMVGLIDEVEAAGLAQRHRSRTDRRAFEVRLTPAGSALVERINALIPKLDRQLGKGLSPSEQAELAALLRRAADALELSPGVHPRLQGGAAAG